MVVGSSLGELTLFGWKGSHKEGLNGTLCLIQCHFRFGN